MKVELPSPRNRAKAKHCLSADHPWSTHLTAYRPESLMPENTRKKLETRICGAGTQAVLQATVNRLSEYLRLDRYFPTLLPLFAH